MCLVPVQIPVWMSLGSATNVDEILLVYFEGKPAGLAAESRHDFYSLRSRALPLFHDREFYSVATAIR